jgi:hypothetical protein
MVGPRIDPQAPRSRFRVGDRVRFRWGQPVVGEIVEDRGHIGAGGRRLWYVRFHPDEYNEMIAVLTDEEMEPAPPSAG